jgi:hypothetical protein
MKTKVYIVLGVAIVLFVAYLYFFKSPEYFKQLTVAPTGPVLMSLPEAPPSEPIAPAGPASSALGMQGPAAPAQRSTQGPRTIPEPTERDPYADSYKESNFGDDNRGPERSFGPAPLPTETDLRLGAGIDSATVTPFAPAVQMYASEAAQNGGEFMGGGVFANDLETPTSFSSF